jgi:competence protein ComEA
MDNNLKRVIKEVKDFFTFSKGERRGVLVLISLILLLILFNYWYPRFVSHQKYDHSAFDREVKAFLNSQEKCTDSQKAFLPKEDFNILDADHSAAAQKLNPFSFDPNSLSHNEWRTMGLSEKQVKVIENYHAKGGKFYKKEDFKKMFCISATEYEILEPFIEIKISKPEYPKKEYPKKETIIKTDINSASVEDLIKVKGIGNYFATQIVKYRIKLGGYFSINQLLEIPKMDTSRFNPLILFLEVNPNAIHKINVNKADFEQLKSHPYIGYNIALSLVNYRSKHGNFVQLSDIKKSLLINDKNYEKISYYLCVE